MRAKHQNEDDTLSGARAEQGGGEAARRHYRVLEALRHVRGDEGRAVVDRPGPHPMPKLVLLESHLATFTIQHSRTIADTMVQNQGAFHALMFRAKANLRSCSFLVRNQGTRLWRKSFSCWPRKDPQTFFLVMHPRISWALGSYHALLRGTSSHKYFLFS